MAYVTLAEVKTHLKVEYDTEDTYIATLIEVAEQAISNELQCELAVFASHNTLPRPLHHAILLQVGDLYNNRESVAPASLHEVPRSIGYLLQPYKKYNRGCSDDTVVTPPQPTAIDVSNYITADNTVLGPLTNTVRHMTVEITGTTGTITAMVSVNGDVYTDTDTFAFVGPVETFDIDLNVDGTKVMLKTTGTITKAILIMEE